MASSSVNQVPNESMQDPLLPAPSDEASTKLPGHMKSDTGTMTFKESLVEYIESVAQYFLSHRLIIHAFAIVALSWVAGYLQINLAITLTWGMMYFIAVEHFQRDRIFGLIRHKVLTEVDMAKGYTETESVAWLNAALERVWGIFLERAICNNPFVRMLPALVEKYKPKALDALEIDSFTFGSSPPRVSNARTFGRPQNGDHVVLEVDLDYVAAPDGFAVVSAKIAKLGMWTKAYISNITIRGKLRVGFRFIPNSPFISRIRVSFVDTPKINMSVKPLSRKGINVVDLPMVATLMEQILGWLLGMTVVAPNMLVVDVWKLNRGSSADSSASKSSAERIVESVTVQQASIVSIVRVEIISAHGLAGMDRSGLSDPYVKLKLGSKEYKTTTQIQTLSPTWSEEFMFHVDSWATAQVLSLRMLDKDDWSKDDLMGQCTIDLAQYQQKAGERHEKALPLQGGKGMLRVAVTVDNVGGTADQTPLGDKALGEGAPLNEDVEALIARYSASAAATGDATPVEMDLGVGEPGSVYISGPAVPRFKPTLFGRWFGKKGLHSRSDSQIVFAGVGESETSGRAGKKGKSEARSGGKVYTLRCKKTPLLALSAESSGINEGLKLKALNENDPYQQWSLEVRGKEKDHKGREFQQIVLVNAGTGKAAAFAGENSPVQEGDVMRSVWTLGKPESGKYYAIRPAGILTLNLEAGQQGAEESEAVTLPWRGEPTQVWGFFPVGGSAPVKPV